MQRRSLTYKKETRSVISYRIAPSYFNCPPLAFFLQKANGIVYIGKSFVFQCTVDKRRENLSKLPTTV